MINLTVICSRILPAVFCISSANSEFIFFITHLIICNIKQRKNYHPMGHTIYSYTLIILFYINSIHSMFLHKLRCWPLNKMLDCKWKENDVVYFTMLGRIWFALIYIMHLVRILIKIKMGRGGGHGISEEKEGFASRSGAKILFYMGQWKIHGMYIFFSKINALGTCTCRF